MTRKTQSGELLERREEVLADATDLWENLTEEQKFAANSLTKFGYELNFIRDVNNTHLAILCCNEEVAVISKVGEINTDPDINIRL